MASKLTDSSELGELDFDIYPSLRLEMRMRFVLLWLLFTVSALAPAANESGTRAFQINWQTDLAITAGALVTGAVPYLTTDKLITSRCPCPLNELNDWDRGVVGNRSDTALTFTDIGLTLALATPYAISYWDQGNLNDVFWEEALLHTEALAIAGALTSVTKHIVQRPLPRTYEGDPALINDAGGYRSFFSGHTAMTAAALASSAFTLRLRNKVSPWIWALPIGGAALIGWGRIAGGVHFYTDVITGLGVGMATGVLVPFLHEIRTPEQSWYIIPERGGIVGVWVYRL